jgi:hypothetical protein
MPFDIPGRLARVAGAFSIFAFLTVLPLLAAPAQAEEFDEHLSIPGTSLRVVNLIGEVRIQGHDGSAFLVDVHVRGKDANRERVHLERPDGSKETLVVRFPVDSETHYVYPPLGAGSTTNFHWNPDGGNEHFGIKEIVGMVANRRIRVSGKGDGLELWADLTVLVPRGGKLEFQNGCGIVAAEDVEGTLRLDTHSGTVSADRVKGDVSADTGSGEVRVASVTGNVLADTGSGSVHIEDVTGDVNADTGSGSVTVLHARSTHILADTGSGSVSLSDISCEKLSVDTGSGTIEVTAASLGSGVFDTGSGGVELALDRLGSGPIRVDTGSGSLVLDLPPSPSATIKASTGSGGIDVDIEGVDWITNERRDKSFRVGKGDAQVVLDTGSGSIRVRI